MVDRYTGVRAGTHTGACCHENIHAVAGVPPPRGGRWGHALRQQVIVYSYSQSALGARSALTILHGDTIRESFSPSSFLRFSLDFYSGDLSLSLIDAGVIFNIRFYQ